MKRPSVIFGIALMLATAISTSAVTAVPNPAPEVWLKDKPPGLPKTLVKMPAGEPTHTFTVGKFTKVEAGSALHLIIRKGSQHKMAAYGPKEVIDRLEVKEKNGQLSVFEKDRDKSTENRKNQEPVVLVIEAPDITLVHLSGASKAVVEDINTNVFAFSLSGASQGQLHITCSKLKLDGSGASRIEVAGKATELAIDLSGASRLQSKELNSQKVSIDASGASTAHLQAGNSLKVEASGASRIKYEGKPATLKSELSGASRLSRI